MGFEVLRLYDLVHQSPLLGPLALDTLGSSAKHVGKIPPYFALIGNARESTGAGKNSQERKFGKAHRRRTIVNQHDFVASQCQFVAASCRGAVARGDKLQP